MHMQPLWVCNNESRDCFLHHRPPAVPGSVSSFSTPSSDFTSVVLNWDPPPVDEEFFRNFNYSLQWFLATPSEEVPASESQPPTNLPSNRVGSSLVVTQRQTEIEFLQPNVSYWFYITAISSEGAGEGRMSVTATTLEIG